MIDDRAVRDLELSEVSQSIGSTTLWGTETFLNTLKLPTNDYKTLKQRQLPIMALRLDATFRNELTSSLKKINTQHIDDIIKEEDSRVTESVEQILWKPASIAHVLNNSSVWLNCLIFWKTILMPCIAVLMPIVALVVPYIFLRIKQSNVDMSAYLERMRGVIMQQITIPVALRSQNNNDILGFLLERLFLGITVATFIASIWNQITPAIHLRSIWFELEERGTSCLSLIRWLCTVRDTCKTPAYKEVVKRVHIALEPVEHLLSGGGVAAYAYFRNHRDVLSRIRNLVGELDVILSIASLRRICFSKYGNKTAIVNLRHPLLLNCIPNTIANTTNHIILTGPNRGGKSTFLKAYALATLTAQTWGFCWAKSASVPLYSSIFISLTPAPVLGKTSTFEAEIDAASAICACSDTPQFVMMDEIFHSTNAYDGTAATKIFLDRLYSKQDVTSIISTHYHEVAVGATGVTQLMMNTGSDLKHSYKVVSGVNKHSSVMEILQERGLCVPTVKQS